MTKEAMEEAVLERDRLRYSVRRFLDSVRAHDEADEEHKTEKFWAAKRDLNELAHMLDVETTGAERAKELLTEDPARAALARLLAAVGACGMVRRPGGLTLYADSDRAANELESARAEAERALEGGE